LLILPLDDGAMTFGITTHSIMTLSIENVEKIHEKKMT
jgi:hypothetical protein